MRRRNKALNRSWSACPVNWEKLRVQLAREAREYLQDLRDIKDSLQYLEGWIALGLVAAAILIAIAWALVTLGFNPPNEHIAKFMYKLGARVCRPISNFHGVIVIVDTMLLVFLTTVTLGTVINQMDRVKRGRRRNPRDLIFFASLMLAVGVGGIVHMRWIC